jgi:hypothetical protein
MADTAARLAISARRNEVARFTIAVTGIDMTGVAMAMQIRLGRDVPGAPLIALTTVTTLAAEGLKLDSVTVTNGVPTSIIKGRINASTMTDATKVPYMGEIGTDSVLAYAMQWTLGGDAQTRLYGDFIVVGSAFGSDGAPTNRPPSYGASQSSSGGASSGSLTFGDQVIAITLASSDLVGIEVAKAIAAAALATTAANDANVVATGTDLRSAASKVIAVGTDLLLGAASKIAIVAGDLALGAGSLIARAVQAAIDAQTARTGAEAALGATAGLLAAYADTDSFGRSAANPPINGTAMTTGTYVPHMKPVARNGTARVFRCWASSAGTVTLKRFSRAAGNVFTQVGADLAVNVVVGLNAVAIAMPVLAGEYLGFSTVANRLVQTAGAAGTADNEGWFSGGVAVSTFTDTTIRNDIRLEVGFDVEYNGVTKGGLSLEAECVRGCSTATFCGWFEGLFLRSSRSIDLVPECGRHRAYHRHRAVNPLDEG